MVRLRLRPARVVRCSLTPLFRLTYLITVRLLGLPGLLLSAQCHDFTEAAGDVGDAYLLHPYILHTRSQTMLRISPDRHQPPLTLAGPLRLDRPNLHDHSLVELAVRSSLAAARVGVHAEPATGADRATIGRGPETPSRPGEPTTHPSRAAAVEEGVTGDGPGMPPASACFRRQPVSVGGAGVAVDRERGR